MIRLIKLIVMNIIAGQHYVVDTDAYWTNMVTTNRT